MTLRDEVSFMSWWEKWNVDITSSHVVAVEKIPTASTRRVDGLVIIHSPSPPNQRRQSQNGRELHHTTYSVWLLLEDEGRRQAVNHGTLFCMHHGPFISAMISTPHHFPYLVIRLPVSASTEIRPSTRQRETWTAPEAAAPSWQSFIYNRLNGAVVPLCF